MHEKYIPSRETSSNHPEGVPSVAEQTGRSHYLEEDLEEDMDDSPLLGLDLLAFSLALEAAQVA